MFVRERQDEPWMVRKVRLKNLDLVLQSSTEAWGRRECHQSCGSSAQDVTRREEQLRLRNQVEDNVTATSWEVSRVWSARLTARMGRRGHTQEAMQRHNQAEEVTGYRGGTRKKTKATPQFWVHGVGRVRTYLLKKQKVKEVSVHVRKGPEKAGPWTSPAVYLQIPMETCSWDILYYYRSQTPNLWVNAQP